MSQQDNSGKGNGSDKEPAEASDPSTPLSTALETIKPKIEAEIATLLRERGAPDGQKAQRAAERVERIVISAVKQELFQGPLPHPSHLAAYEQACPGAADRILKMAETEQQHRHGWEKRALNFEFVYSFGGLVFGFLVALGLLAGAMIEGNNGHEAVAGGFLAASAIGMVSTFIKGREIFQKKPPAPAVPAAPVKPQNQARGKKKR